MSAQVEALVSRSFLFFFNETLDSRGFAKRAKAKHAHLVGEICLVRSDGTFDVNQTEPSLTVLAALSSVLLSVLFGDLLAS